MTRCNFRVGDCRLVLATFEECSVDACVTDPPYELGFLNKKWDATGIANDVDMWRQVLRVLKPGGHLLAFGGTRTYHRMACAIEDAGFEIRDSLMWLQGQGFPKSLNITKAVGDAACTCPSSSECAVRPLSESNVSAPIDAEGERGEVLQHCVSQSGISVTGAASVGGSLRGEQPSLEGRSNVQAGQGELYRAEVCAVSVGVSSDGAQGRLRNGASVSGGEAHQTLSDANGSGPPSRSQHAKQRAIKSGAVADKSKSQASGAWSLCGRCGKPIVPAGLGTALKPGHEPIVMARKPLDGTVSENVVKWGVGVINIAACRIGFSENEPYECHWQGAGPQPAGWKPSTQGRWPANVILDEDAAAELDEQSVVGGIHFAGNKGGTSGKGLGYHGTNRTDRLMPASPAESSLGASRFFYVAKPSRAERDAGCAHLPSKTLKNHHPTVKPITLMCYLVRLVTPLGGLVLDPFAGSGTTGIAALREGARFVGIDLEPEYASIAVARLGKQLMGVVS